MHEDRRLIKLTNISSKIDTNILTSQLRASGIESFIKSPGAGDYLNIIGMESVQGQDIYVESQYYNEAVEILKRYKKRNTDETNKVTTIRRVAAILVLLMILAGLILSIVNGI